MKKLSALVLAAVLLCVALVGCGGNDPAKEYIGTWEAVEVTAYDETLDEGRLSEWKQSSEYFYFELNENGTAELTDEGLAYPGTWTVDKEGKASFESDALISATLELKDGQLIAKYDYFDDPRTIIYERIDPSAKTQAPTLKEYYESDKVIEENRPEGTIDDLTAATEMNVVAVDDDLCTIKIAGKGSYNGNPSIILELTNKSDEKITIYNEEGWTASGINNNPFTLIAPVRAGETCSVIMCFDHEQIGEDPSVLTDVSGKLSVYGPVDSRGFSTELAMYDIAF